MRITKLDLANYRGLNTPDENNKLEPYKSLTFDPKFNVIIGVNGVGKTSVLDALAILISRILPRVTPSKEQEQRFVLTDFRAGSRTITARLWFEAGNTQTSYSLVQTALKPKHIEDADKSRLQEIARLNDSQIPESTASTPIALFYTADRAGYQLKRKNKRPLLGRSLAYQGALRERSINYRSIVDWLNATRALAKESEIAQRALEITNEALNRFLPAFGKLDASGSQPKLYVTKNGVRLGIEQLSHGERSFLALVVDTARHLAQANPASADPLTNGQGIVLIDELELHLHPKWQRTSIEQLQATFPALQFIVTTHSPFVIQSLAAGQLINLDPRTFAEEYADQSIEDITEFVMGVTMPQKSQRYQQMMDTAEEYFRLLRTVQPATPEEKSALKSKLDELSIPFSDDPAYMALLKVERETYLGSD